MQTPCTPATTNLSRSESLIPQAGLAGDMRISYGKFLQLLEGNRIKRVVVYGDMQTAVVEVRPGARTDASGVPAASSEQQILTSSMQLGFGHDVVPATRLGCGIVSKETGSQDTVLCHYEGWGGGSEVLGFALGSLSTGLAVLCAQVPHPWYASVAGSAETYSFAETRDGKPISLLIPNPAAPDDPL